MRASFYSILLFVPMVSSAQASCGDWLGRTPAFVSMDSIAKRFGALKPKDEFETTAAFTARMRSLVSPAEVFVFEKPIEDLKYLLYNADEGALTVQSFALHNSELYWDGFFRSLGRDDMRVSSFSNFAVALRSIDSTRGSYQAQTALGVRFTVTRIDRMADGLFEGPKPAWPDSGFMPFKQLETIPMSPDEARTLKSSVRAAWVLSPREPYFLAGSFNSGVASLSHPRDIRNVYRVAIGRLDCALLLDGSGRVYRSYETRIPTRSPASLTGRVPREPEDS